MTTIIGRAGWGAKPAESRTPWNPDTLSGVAVHHFAVPRSASSKTGSAALMRGVQRAHMAGEFSDIAYNHCFDKWGQIFEGRGFNVQTGANGNQVVNKTHAAICYMGDSDLDGFPEAAQDAAAFLLSEWFKRGVSVKVVSHGDISPDGTDCPGGKAEAWVHSGAWKKDLPSAKRVQFMLRDDGEIIAKSRVVPIEQSFERMKLFRQFTDTLTHKRLAAEGAKGLVGFERRVLL